MTVSNIEAGQVARLYELWYEQSLLDDTFIIRGGLITTDDFMSSDTASIFMNDTFGWNALFGTDLPAGGADFPFTVPGVMLRIKPTENLYFLGGVYSGDPTGGIGSNQSGPEPTGTVLNIRGGAFFIGEVGYQVNPDGKSEGLPAAYKIGGWYQTGSHFSDQYYDTSGVPLASPLSNGIPQNHSDNWALYAAIDQTLFRVGEGNQGLSGFARITGSPGAQNLLDFYVDGGLVYTGLIPGRPDDKIGIAVAYAQVSNSVQQLDRDIGFYGEFPYPVQTAETVIELTYLAQLAPWWTLQADLQYVIRPSGGVLNEDGTFRENAWVTGLRTVLSF